MDATLKKHIIALERQVWNALVSGDKAADHALLADDFLGVYGDGFAGKSDHTGQLETGPTVMDYNLADFRLRPLGEDHVLLSYRATFRRCGASASEVMFVSSVWQWQNSTWVNIFSQDTARI
ncbi:hypothetical protein Z945_443 [Sulfitobacter noctilucae]|uniref:nuclear transport factor 2 family protein n=1 Tax=Sulfitobacter noctilucae TaxID=1342302 RepID=UPI00046A9AB2|nr:nuclear transport factor 2 family protein [Sulfitobacter noctilucae]KIN65401.1 hypothetical protein Z945_443 [Sulfitobacter noctilucae]